MTQIQFQINEEKKKRFMKKIIDEGKTLTEKLNELIDQDLKKGKK